VGGKKGDYCRHREFVTQAAVLHLVYGFTHRVSGGVGCMAGDQGRGSSGRARDTPRDHLMLWQLRGAKVVKGRLKERAQELGFGILGAASVSEFEGHPSVTKPWRDGDCFHLPRELWPDARSVVVVGMRTIDEVLDSLVDIEGLRVLFYFEVIHHRLGILRDWLREQGVGARLADEAISYKRAAVLAGLGYAGKNSLVATPEYGSNVRFGVLLTDAELPVDRPNDPLRPRCARDATGVSPSARRGNRGVRDRLQEVSRYRNRCGWPAGTAGGAYSAESRICRRVQSLSEGVSTQRMTGCPRWL